MGDGMKTQKITLFIVLGIFLSILIGVTIYSFSGKEEEKEEITPPTYSPQNAQDYTRVDDIAINDDNVDKNTLIKFNDYLYALATKDIIIEGDLLYTWGYIDYLTDKENVPIRNSETNDVNYLGLKVVRFSYDELIVEKNNEAILFRAIAH